MGTSDPSEASVYYPSTLHFTRENWNIPQLIYIIGLWDGEHDGDKLFDVTFTLVVKGEGVMDPFFHRRLYTYPTQTFMLWNRDVSESFLYLDW